MSEEKELETRYLIGVDLGKKQDRSAVCVVKRFLEPGKVDPVKGGLIYEAQYQVLYLKRFPRGTNYTDVKNHVKEVCLTEPMRNNLQLLVDASGVGLGLVDTLNRETLLDTGIYAMPITITGGNRVTYADGGYRVPKVELVMATLHVVEGDRLGFAEDLQDLEVLKRELHAFQIKNTKSENEIYEAHEGEHDDIVIATALACWYGENHMLRAPLAPQPPWHDPYAFIR